jgi:hypothetical protein
MMVGIRVIDVSTIYTGTAKLADLPQYEAAAIEQAGNGNVVTLTGPGPVWLYLCLAHTLHGKALILNYDSPVSGLVEVFNHNPR